MPRVYMEGAAMVTRYHLSIWRKVGNVWFREMLRVGLAPRAYYLLTVTGRKSGQPRSTPVRLVESDAGRWLVAPYGAVSWVHNVRAAGEVTLDRGRQSEKLRAVELNPDRSAVVLKTYLSENPITRSFFAVTADSSLDAFRAEASRHPVFALGESTVAAIAAAGDGDE